MSEPDRTDQICFKVSKLERLTLEAVASWHDVHMSVLLRDLIWNAAKEMIQPLIDAQGVAEDSAEPLPTATLQQMLVFNHLQDAGKVSAAGVVVAG